MLYRNKKARNHFIQFNISPSFKKVAKNGSFCKHIHKFAPRYRYRLFKIFFKLSKFKH